MGFGNMECFYSMPRFWGILKIWPRSPQELPMSMSSREPNFGGGLMGQIPFWWILWDKFHRRSWLKVFPAEVLGDNPRISLQHHLFSLHRNSWPSSRITVGKSQAPGDGAPQERRFRASQFCGFGFPLALGVSKEHPGCKNSELGTD